MPFSVFSDSPDCDIHRRCSLYSGGSLRVMSYLINDTIFACPITFSYEGNFVLVGKHFTASYIGFVGKRFFFSEIPTCI